MGYYLFNIGGPYTDEWWARNVLMGIITTGFDNRAGDQGEHLLQTLCEGDWVIAYASGYGAVGAGRVLGEDTYQLLRHRDLPANYESDHRHIRSVQWIYFFSCLEDAIPFAQLQLNNRHMPTRIRLSDQNARRIIRLFRSRAIRNQSRITDEQADARRLYVPAHGDRRPIVERQIRIRRGQQQFRDVLLERYERRCAITGCRLMAVLEAAHINPYRGDEDHHPENGLLLRTDIHTLFDLDLLGINPDTLCVELHPSLVREPEYRRLGGVSLRCPNDRVPSRAALSQRYQMFLAHREEP